MSKLVSTKSKAHWMILRNERVKSVVHCKTGDRILVVTNDRAYAALFSDRFKAPFSKFVTGFERAYPGSECSHAHDNYDMFAYMRLSAPLLGAYTESFASDYSMDYDHKPYPSSTNYVLNLDTLAKKGIEVIGYDKPKEWL